MPPSASAASRRPPIDRTHGASTRRKSRLTLTIGSNPREPVTHYARLNSGVNEASIRWRQSSARRLDRKEACLTVSPIPAISGPKMMQEQPILIIFVRHHSGLATKLARVVPPLSKSRLCRRTPGGPQAEGAWTVALKLYNTLTRKKEVFEPLDASNVRMYVCGPTVYDFAHIGNARPVIVFDVLFRLLRHLYGPEHVTYVRNITDVDDKINARAAQDYPGLPLNEAIRRVTEKTEAQFHADMKALGALDPTVEPRATEHIEQMKAMIERLVEQGLRLCGRGPCAVRRRLDARLRQALGPLARRDDRGRAGRGGALQARPDGFRAVEAVEARRAVMAVARRHRGAGAPRLAYRMLGHGRSLAVGRGEAQAVKGGARAARICSTSMAAASTSSFPITRTRSRNRAAPTRRRSWRRSGCITASSRSRERRWRSALGNFVTIHELLRLGRLCWPGEALRFNMLRTHYRQPLDWTLVESR